MLDPFRILLKIVRRQDARGEISLGRDADQNEVDIVFFEILFIAVPHRGERNEPAWIPLIAAKVAEELGLSVEEVEKQTYDNFLTFYRISL